MNNKVLHMVAFLLTAIGAINWGLVSLFDTNLVAMLFGSMPPLERVVYIVIAVSAVYILVTHQKDCKVCGSKK